MADIALVVEFNEAYIRKLIADEAARYLGLARTNNPERPTVELLVHGRNIGAPAENGDSVSATVTIRRAAVV